MSRRRVREQTVFLPWERRKGFLGNLGRSRLRLALQLSALLGIGLFVRSMDGYRAKVRATRATMLGVYPAIDAFLADHEEGCPGSLQALVEGGYLSQIPHDAWHQPLRFTCPAHRPPARYELVSDGPDGLEGGLDQIR